MILSGREIIKEIKNGKIFFDPFNEEHVTTNSVDIILGCQIIRYKNEIIDPAKPNKYETITINKNGYLLNKGNFVLGHSQNIIGSDYYVPMLHARSGIARLGLFVHVTADLIDIGSHGNITFQLYATLPIKIIPGMRIGQISFWKPKGEIDLYQGKYQGSVGPRASEIYRDFGITEP